MKTPLYILLAIVLLTGTTGCKKINGKGDTITEHRTVTNYSSIEVSIPATVNFRPDSVYSLSVSAQENLVSYIETEVDGGQLLIRMRDHYSLGKHDPVTVTITAPSVSSLAVSGSGDFNVSGAWAPGDTRLSISGSGSILVDTLSAGFLKQEISGSGSIKINRGSATASDLVISGSGSMHTENVRTNNSSATISGSGDIYCWVIEKLIATISGSGSIYYHGDPNVEVYVSGSGTVKHL